MSQFPLCRYGVFGSALGMSGSFGVRFRAISRNRAISIACYARNKNPVPPEFRRRRRERIERELRALRHAVEALGADAPERPPR